MEAPASPGKRGEWTRKALREGTHLVMMGHFPGNLQCSLR